jgi:hypothetical protein
MSPGSIREPLSGSNSQCAGGKLAAASNNEANVTERPCCSQVRSDSCKSHRPITLRKNRIVPSTPCSLVNPAFLAFSWRMGRSTSTPTSDHVPDDKKSKRGVLRRYGNHGRGGVVGSDHSQESPVSQSHLVLQHSVNQPACSPGRRNGANSLVGLRACR